MRAHKQYGMTLIELMVALAIGSFLMIGAITVFMQSRTTFRITESVARLQENARFAVDALEPDIRMAHYWGLTTVSANVTNRAAPTAANGPGPDTCGNNFTINLDQAVAGNNNSYGFACAGFAPVEVNADTLVVRRVSEDPLPLPLPAAAAALYLQTVRGTGNSQIFVGPALPGSFNPATNQVHRLLVSGYYVSRSSSFGAGLPSLRRHALRADGTMTPGGGEEIIAGVEDFQVQFGVDTDLPDTADRGSIDRWLNPNDPMIDPTNAAFNLNAEILAVRIWVRVRAERAENGFTDQATYVYADRNVGPFNDGFRRLVVSKTIYLRNARPLS